LFNDVSLQGQASQAGAAELQATVKFKLLVFISYSGLKKNTILH
jgi:hypothetical protein